MFLCETCNTIHTACTECCGRPTIPLSEALGFREQLFEMEGNDRAQNVLHHLKCDYEAASQAVVKAAEKLEQLKLARDATATTLLDFYKLSAESAR